ncbi:TIGR04104 family putative zinc finger protein [[Clostridium] fimetarium]|uniref:Cxxc_20_cxxc protein n=1 Tax=[Clostridium] fimetarium TaxID=99656 RepID=A0A1I0R1W9_9FIRM|nr:TIGR04104 family putative zinc finger protein [[Clostridium] fimetarium]SEW34472.1 cxxc_20_cxxc protein [[Clostridium] fimetarium]
MQKCKKCNDKLGYKNIFWTLLFGYAPIICESCGCTYYVRFSTRIIYACLIALPPLLMNHLFNALNFANRSDALVCYLIWVVFVILVMPFGARYYTKDDGKVGE